MNELSIADNIITTALCSAARRGDSDVLCQLLEKGHHVNLHDNRGWTPLHEAVAHGHLNCVRLLLQHDECDKEASTFDGMSPMYVACEYQNNVDLVKLLVEYGVGCDGGNNENVTPLHVACKLCKFDFVKELIKHGAAINAEDFNNFTPIMDVIDQVTTVWNERNETPLEIVRFLLVNGASVSATDLFGRTAFFIATYAKWKECIELLLEFGSDVNVRTLDGGSALMIASQHGDFSLVKLLLDHGAATDIICDKGTMPLHHALHHGCVSVAEELMKKMNFKEINGRKKKKFESFLILAVDSGSYECFKLVMNNKLYSNLDRTPFSSAEMSTLLNENYFHHYLYQTPLCFLLSHHLVEPHAEAMVKSMLDSDFSLNAFNQDFMPPLTALISGAIDESDKTHTVNQIKLEWFMKFLEKGADVDYHSVKNCPGNLEIPDAVMAVIMPRECSVPQFLILPVLAHSFACNWDDLFDWLAKYETCSTAALNVLVKLGTKSKHSLLKVWDKIKHCPCHICKNDFPNTEKSLYEKNVTLQSLSRVQVRRWLWEKTKNSNEASKLLYEMRVPLPVKQYIIPVKLNFN